MGKEQKQNPEEVLERKLDRLRRRREFCQIFIECLVLVGTIYVLLHYVVGIAFVSGGSMEPTLLNGELVVFYRLDQDYRDGDIVVIRREDDIQYIKRIAACGGELVDDTVEGVEEACEVPGGAYFVLGDHLEDSVDSRSFGVVWPKEIEGRVFFHLGMTR